MRRHALHCWLALFACGLTLGAHAKAAGSDKDENVIPRLDQTTRELVELNALTRDAKILDDVDPLVKAGKPDYAAIDAHLHSLSTDSFKNDRQRREALTRLYKTLPVLSDSENVRAEGSTQAWNQGELKAAMVTQLQRHKMIPDYEASFKKAHEALDLVGRQMTRLNGTEPPELVEQIQTRANALRGLTEFVGREYMLTLHQPAGPSSRSYKQLQKQQQKWVSQLGDMMEEAANLEASVTADSLSGKDGVSGVKTWMKFYKVAEELREAGFAHARSYLPSAESDPRKLEGFSGLVGAEVKIAGDSLKEVEKLDKLARGMNAHKTILDHAFNSWEDEHKEHVSSKTALLGTMTKDEKKALSAKLAHEGHAHMHEGDAIAAARSYETARIVDDTLGLGTKIGRTFTGYVDLDKEIEKAVSATTRSGATLPPTSAGNEALSPPSQPPRAEQQTPSLHTAPGITRITERLGRAERELNLAALRRGQGAASAGAAVTRPSQPPQTAPRGAGASAQDRQLREIANRMQKNLWEINDLTMDAFAATRRGDPGAIARYSAAAQRPIDHLLDDTQQLLDKLGGVLPQSQLIMYRRALAETRAARDMLPRTVRSPGFQDAPRPSVLTQKTNPSQMQEDAQYVPVAQAVYGDWLQPKQDDTGAAVGALKQAGWRQIDVRRDSTCGFYAAVYQKGNRTVLAFRGTEGMGDAKDRHTDEANALGLATRQYRQAGAYARDMKLKYGDSLVLIGHSLGGGLAQYASAQTGLETITFNTAAVAKGPLAEACRQSTCKPEKVRNYVHRSDILGNVANPATSGDIGKTAGVVGEMMEKALVPPPAWPAAAMYAGTAPLLGEVLYVGSRGEPGRAAHNLAGMQADMLAEDQIQKRLDRICEGVKPPTDFKSSEPYQGTRVPEPVTLAYAGTQSILLPPPPPPPPPGGAAAEPNIGGVEINYAKQFEVDAKLAGVKVNPETGRMVFESAARELYEIAPIPPDIWDALCYIYHKYGSVSQLAFTLVVEKPEMDRCKKELNRYIDQHTAEMRAAAKGPWNEVKTVRVRNIPYWLGAEYGDTIVGRAALDADVALKFLSSGLDPSDPARQFALTDRYRRNVEAGIESSFARMWLYLKSASLTLDEQAGRKVANIAVTVGIKTKAIRYVDDEQTEDIGEAPAATRECAEILEQHYDTIARRVPSWRLLRDVYRGIAVIQLLEAIGTEIPKPRTDEQAIRKYAKPAGVDGLVAWGVNGNRLKTTVGGVSYSLRSRDNAEDPATQAFHAQITKLARSNDKNPFWRAVNRMRKWDLADAVAQCSYGLETKPDDWRLYNLRGVATVCRALNCPAPNGQPAGFEVLEKVLGEDFLPNLKTASQALSDWDLALLGQARSDLEQAAAQSPLLPRENLDLLNSLQRVPAEQASARAFDEKEAAGKREGYRRAVDLFFLTGDYHLAADRLKYLCAQSPNDPLPHLERTGVLLQAAHARAAKEPDPTSVLIFPLEPQRDAPTWLCEGLPHLLHEVARGTDAVRVLDPGLLAEGARILKYSPQELLQSSEARAQVADLYGLEPDYLAWGTLDSRGGNVVELRWQFKLRKGTDEPREVRVRGMLNNPRAFAARLVKKLSFETIERTPARPAVWRIPGARDSLETWCAAARHRTSGSEQALKTFLNTRKEADSEAALTLAELALRAGDTGTAAALLEGIAESYNGDWRYWHLRGTLALARDRTAEARGNLQKALELEPNAAPTTRLLAALAETDAERVRLNTKQIENGSLSVAPYLNNAVSALGHEDVVGAARTLNLYLARARRIDRATLRDLQGVWLAACRAGGL